MTAPPREAGSRFLLVLLAVLLLASAFVVWPFITGTVFALVLGYLLRPLYRRLLRVVRLRPVAALLVLLLVVAAIVGPLVFIGYQLAADVARLAEDAGAGGGYEAAAVDAVATLGVDEATARAWVAKAGDAAVSAAQAAIGPAVGRLALVVTGVLVFLFVLYYTLVDGELLSGFIVRSVPLPDDRVHRLLDTVGLRVKALFQGTFLVSVIQGVAAGLGWWYFGFPAPFFWGFVMTILAILPGGAPFLVLVPAGVLAILQGNLYAGIGILVYSAVVVGLVDNVARPFVVGRSADVHPALVLVGTLGGLVVFGTTGFLLGPLVLSMIGPVVHEWERGWREPAAS